MRIPSQVEIAYFAGLFDGEGTVNIAQRKRKRKRCRIAYKLSIQIGLAHLPVLEKIKEIWQIGSINGPYQKKDYKPQWRWDAESNQAAKILEVCLPYLCIKKPEAELAIAFQREKSKQRKIWGHNRNIPKRYFTQEAELSEELKNIRHLGLSTIDLSELTRPNDQLSFLDN